ncbi:MAG: ABC transporter ATP-binding protein [Chloroflexi bacterium HGW-Chloroflexi-4]|jgi:ABC-2 type transport system ATP-binding protein|nr:MAG: ABC transporter ATP-binding protein [Chloroflexi bacterium HGW-Chloroflexi-4]
MNTIIAAKGITKLFAGKPALDQVSFSIESGRIVGLMGPNGAGKTTLIKSIMQLYHLDGGTIDVCGAPASYRSREFLAYMPDTNALFNWMSIHDAIHYYKDMNSDFDLVRARDLCNSLQLDEKGKVKHLSKGTIERVLIMLTFARNARLYLLDEPIGGVDPLGRGKILRTILAGVNEESSVLISTHLVKDVEAIVDDLLFIHNGRILLSESADHLRETRGQSIEECYLEVFENA